MGNGEGSFTELKRFGKPAGGLGPDNRVGAYIGDSWKVKPNFTLSYGLRYDRDTGRTDSDISLPAINNFIPGAGNAVRQPNHNFAPQAGFAWDPKSDGKTVIRGGVGIFYDNIVFNDVLFDRELKLASGQFNATQDACNSGPAGGLATGGGVGFGDGSTNFLGGTQATANVICNTPIGATVGAGGGNCAGQIFYNCNGGLPDWPPSFLRGASYRRERDFPADSLANWRSKPYRRGLPRPGLQVPAVDSNEHRHTARVASGNGI